MGGGGGAPPRPPPPPPVPPLQCFPGVQLNSLLTYRRALLSERLEQASTQVKQGRQKHKRKDNKNGQVRSSCACAYAYVVALTSEN